MSKILSNETGVEVRTDISRIYQLVQEPGTLNFIKSRIAIDRNMAELENRTIL